MAKFLQVLVILFLISPTIIHAETNETNVKIAFIKDGYLWMKVNDKEVKLTDKKATYNYPPQWSYDGKMVLYQKEVVGNIKESKRTSNELWVYDLETKKHLKIFYDGYSPKWSPIENIVAFQDGGVLNVSNLKDFNNISLGVDDFEWQPNGKGFIASSSASLRPDGWTNPILYTIALEDDYMKNSHLTTNAKELFVIPKEIGKNEVKILSISAGSFTYSPDGKWIAFIVSPTASWAMDSDMLSVISADGKAFEVIDEMILEYKPKWAFNENLLGYIAGGGRIVFGFKNKELKITELPTNGTIELTPKNYSEMGFTWVNDTSLIVSRVPESDWSDDPKKRPKPSLYYLTLNRKEQIKITTPINNKGDYNPIFIPSIDKVTWLRKSDIVSEKGDLWIADTNGKNPKVWVYDVGSYSIYPLQ